VTEPSDGYRTAAETARRLGLTVRALRVYERHGLVRPGRSAAGWRLYGPVEVARLHQVVALKRLGMTLAQIAAVLTGGSADLDSVLALQEDELARQRQKLDRALALVRRARAKLARDKTLPMEDLVELIKETHMTDFVPSPEFQALVAKHTDRERVKAVHAGEWTAADQARVSAQWADLIAQAERLATGDPGSPAALDLARRWREQVRQFTRDDPQLTASLTAIYREGFADPKMAQHMPLSADVARFMIEAIRRLAGSEGASA
jgi:DNA-binding transcriptional MerR regulator